MLYVAVVGANEDAPDLKVYGHVDRAQRRYWEGEAERRHCRLYEARTNDPYDARRLVQIGEARLIMDSEEVILRWLDSVPAL